LITLYQFKFSHYCEKACWALDYKRLPYTTRDLLPGPHMRVARKLAPRTHLPILVDDGQVVQDSTSIITYLDDKFPERRLTLQDSQLAREVLEWEEYLDEELGVPLRLWFYYHTLPDRNRALKFLLEGAPWYGQPLFALIYPRVRAAMQKMMNIHSESAQQSKQLFLLALDKLDSVLKERPFLVGDTFTRADLTACALLSPYCVPGKSDEQVSMALPEQVCALRDQHKSRPFFNWVHNIYREYRY
jgi:glutathione S-transferase